MYNSDILRFWTQLNNPKYLSRLLVWTMKVFNLKLKVYNLKLKVFNLDNESLAIAYPDEASVADCVFEWKMKWDE